MTPAHPRLFLGILSLSVLLRVSTWLVRGLYIVYCIGHSQKGVRQAKGKVNQSSYANLWTCKNLGD